MSKVIKIEGCITIPENLTHTEFLEKFLNFIEDNNWMFGGGTEAYLNDKYVDE